MPRHPDTVITPNTQLSTARQRRDSPRRPGQCLSRAELADAVNATLDQLYPGRDITAHYVDFRWIGKLERGEHRWPSEERRTALRHVLGTATDTELGLYSPRRTDDLATTAAAPTHKSSLRPRMRQAAREDADSTGLHTERPADMVDAMYRRTALVLPALVAVAVTGRPGQPARNAELDLLRKALLTGGGPGRRSDGISAHRARSSTANVHQVYQQAQYIEAATKLPGAIALANDLATQSTGAARRQGEYFLALNYIAAAKVATKFADGPLAWIAAERATQIAASIDAPAISGIAAYQIGCALLQLYPDGEPAEQVVHTSLSILRKADMTPQTIAATGALNLVAAIIAARRGAHQVVVEHLAIASDLSRTVPTDGNELWTAFNRTNVLIHRVSAEISLRRYDQAIEAARSLDSAHLPAALAGRRAQIHLNLATAYAAGADGRAAAIHHVVSASRVAPQLFQIQPTNRQLVASLLRSPGPEAPALRALAEHNEIGA